MDGFGFLFPRGMSGREIYDNFRAGQGPERLEGAGEVVRELISNYEKRAESITNLTTRMESSWQGDAAGAAQRGAGPLAVEHGIAAPEMNTAQELVASQAAVYRFADATVVPIPPTPEKPGFWDNVFSAGQANENYESQVTEVNAANDRNIAVMTSYEDVTSNNTSRMPTSYGSITPDHSAVGVVQQKDPPILPPPHRWQPGQPGNPNQTNNVNTQQQQPQQPPGNDQLIGPNRPQPWNPDQPNQPNQPNGPGLTDPNDYLPPDHPNRPVPPGPGPGPGPNPNNSAFNPGFFPGGGFGPTGGGAGADTSAGRGGAGAGARGFGGTGGPAGEDGNRAGGRGLGPGAAAAEAAAGRGGGMGARGGAGGMGGMPMGGGARGQGDEDGEHQRPSYLVEADPDETFGTDEVTAPPVIGE